MRRITETQRDRILARIEVAEGGCWMWTGALFGNGYARLNLPGRQMVPAHRAAFEEWIGPIPDGLQLDHLCHTRDRNCPGGRACQHRICVNPRHLEPVTVAENLLRSALTIAGSNARKTHCPQGHQYDAATMRVDGTTRKRYCRACMRAAGSRWRARQQASK